MHNQFAPKPSIPPMSSANEALNRRTFAIISHPDAGKTTLTEKLLLFGGAIQLAGHVKARGARRRTRSDWMEIERARGISVTSSVMTFERNGITFNLLDTPGHADFSEDTYRTLSAVDAAVMIIDAAKGIEGQTRKLFEVCRLRDIPIVTFINKVDREGLDPLTLIDQIESDLALELSPMMWPIGMGADFRGCIDLTTSEAQLLGAERSSGLDRTISLRSLDDLVELAGAEPRIVEPALEGLRIAREALPAFDRQAFHEGHLSPLFFGSALKDFGVEPLLDCLAEHAPSPRPRPAMERLVRPGEAAVTGFVFKVQANMDPNHRDRVAFVRLCSGTFTRGMKLLNVREGRQASVTSPIFFFAQNREIADTAFAGDIIGLPNHGSFRVGDTVTEGEQLHFEGIPSFAPDELRRVVLTDAIKSKPFARGLKDLAEEGVVQVFRTQFGDPVIGAVGVLQLDVFAMRMEREYGVAVRFEPTPFVCARWLETDDADILRRFIESYRTSIAEDRDGAPVFLAKSGWALDRAQDEWRRMGFAKTRERGFERMNQRH